MTLGTFLVILGIHLGAVISPGPSFVIAVRTAAAEGFAAASGVALGLGLGALTWALGALTGLALLFEVAPVLLVVMKLVGACALFWIGWQTWRHAADPMPAPDMGRPPRDVVSAVRLGLVTQLANPKPAIFFGAVFIGLVPPDATLPALALLLVAILAQETLWYVLVARAFSLSRARAGYARAKAWIDRAFGGLIFALGLRIATT